MFDFCDRGWTFVHSPISGCSEVILQISDGTRIYTVPRKLDRWEALLLAVDISMVRSGTESVSLQDVESFPLISRDDLGAICRYLPKELGLVNFIEEIFFRRGGITFKFVIDRRHKQPYKLSLRDADQDRLLVDVTVSTMCDLLSVFSALLAGVKTHSIVR